MIKYLIYGSILYFIAHVATWFQMNSQFVFEWARNKQWLTAMIFSIPIGLSFIYGTKYIVEYFGLLWPGKILGFSIGNLVFAMLTYHVMGEAITPKTVVSLILSVALIGVQTFWK